MRRRGVISALGLTLVVAAATAAGSLASTTRHAATSLKGAGSSFVAPLVAQWQANYKSASVDYNPIGSGGGIAAITARTVDFGASDAPLSKDEFASCKGCVQIPWALSATSIPYNLDLNKRLRLNGKVLAGIYLGRIKSWSDKRIKKLNPGVNLPNLKITPVYRSDNSGTSYNFTDYLSHVNTTWKARIGTGTNAKWPAGIGAPKSNGVAAAVSQTKGALGYVDVAYAIKNHLPFAAIQNAAGRYILPGIVGIRAAAATVSKVPAPARAAELRRRGRFHPGDTALHGITLAAALAAVALLGLIAWKVVDQARPAMHRFGLHFLVANDWDPGVRQVFGAAAFVFGTAVTSFGALLIAGPLSIAIALFLTELAPRWLRGPIGTLVEMLAAVPSVVVGLWGILVMGPFAAGHLEPWLKHTFGFLPLFGGDPSIFGLLPAILVL